MIAANELRIGNKVDTKDHYVSGMSFIQIVMKDAMHDAMHDAMKSISKQMHDSITVRLKDTGVLLLTDEIMERFIWVSSEVELFKHLFLDYGSDKEKRVISILKNPRTEISTDPETGAYNITATYYTY